MDVVPLLQEDSSLISRKRAGESPSLSNVPAADAALRRRSRWQVTLAVQPGILQSPHSEFPDAAFAASSRVT